MLFSRLCFTATWLSGIVASSPTAGTSEDPPGLSKNNSKIVVAVGKGSFTFVPDTITADPGDEIAFEFWSDGHSVARSAFGFPCMPYEYIVPEHAGFWSGDILNVTTNSRPTFTITVNDTEPVFFYCSPANSCKGNRMIGVINPNSTWTLDKQNSFINPSILELQPGDPLPSESNGTESLPPDSKSPYEIPVLSIGEIAGIVISSIAVILLVGTLAYTCRHQGRLEKNWQRNTQSNPKNLSITIEPSPQEGYDNTLLSPPLQNHVNSMPAQPTNSSHWSFNSSMTSPCQSSFQLCRPGFESTMPSETSLGHHLEQPRIEAPGSPVLPVELPAGNELHTPKSS
ncbi:hypothetical protein F5Y12DRAFT_733967 [Xylaria sp. FL1777]|nr:hypothetical protein F5Y12DRAFT_733967 [Xylaria sp. FL1777]